ncbi:MAG: alpha/beta hydrolase, partial [Cyanobacteria bacterium J06555_3]
IDSTGIPLISPAEIVRRRFAELPQQIAQLRWQPFIRILLAALYNGIFRRQYLIEGAKISLREDLRPWLKDIKSPCLVLWGERDYFTDLDLGYGLVEAIADSQLQIVPNGYHEWCMMQQEKLAAISCDFFKRIEIESSTPNSYEASKT